MDRIYPYLGHLCISWVIAKGIDLQKVRQCAGHGGLEVISR